MGGAFRNSFPSLQKGLRARHIIASETNFYLAASENKRRRKAKFDPDHEYIENAVEEFLARGGEIKQMCTDPNCPIPETPRFAGSVFSGDSLFEEF